MNRLPEYEAIDASRLLDVQLALIDELPPDLRAIAIRAEPGSARLHPGGEGWIGVTVGVAEPVVLG